MRSYAFTKEGEDKDEDQENDHDLDKASFCGAIYGVRIPNISCHPVILNATGTSIPKLPPTEPIPNVEFLTEVFPCGLDPVGVVRIVDSDEDLDEDEERLSQLLSYLPVSVKIDHVVWARWFRVGFFFFIHSVETAIVIFLFLNSRKQYWRLMILLS